MRSIPYLVKSALTADNFPLVSNPSSGLHAACNDVFRRNLLGGCRMPRPKNEVQENSGIGG